MKTLKIKLYALTLVMLAFSFTSCNQISRVTLLENYDGETLLKHIEENNIELLENTPELKKIMDNYLKTDDERAAIMEFAADMVNNVRSQDPEFYSEFTERLRSSDQKLQDQALQDGVVRFLAEVKVYNVDDLPIQELFKKIYLEKRPLKPFGTSSGIDIPTNRLQPVCNFTSLDDQQWQKMWERLAVEGSRPKTMNSNECQLMTAPQLIPLFIKP